MFDIDKNIVAQNFLAQTVDFSSLGTFSFAKKIVLR